MSDIQGSKLFGKKLESTKVRMSRGKKEREHCVFRESYAVSLATEECVHGNYS